MKANLLKAKSPETALKYHVNSCRPSVLRNSSKKCQLELGGERDCKEFYDASPTETALPKEESVRMAGWAIFFAERCKSPVILLKSTEVSLVHIH